MTQIPMKKTHPIAFPMPSRSLSLGRNRLMIPSSKTFTSQGSSVVRTMTGTVRSVVLM